MWKYKPCSNRRTGKTTEYMIVPSMTPNLSFAVPPMNCITLRNSCLLSIKRFKSAIFDKPFTSSLWVLQLLFTSWLSDWFWPVFAYYSDSWCNCCLLLYASAMNILIVSRSWWLIPALCSMSKLCFWNLFINFSVNRVDGLVILVKFGIYYVPRNYSCLSTVEYKRTFIAFVFFLKSHCGCGICI